jgi:hypothetical protein
MSPNRLRCFLRTTRGRNMACRVASCLLSCGECPPRAPVLLHLLAPITVLSVCLWHKAIRRLPPFSPSRTQQPTSPTIRLRGRPSSPPCPSPVCRLLHITTLAWQCLEWVAVAASGQCQECAATHVFIIPPRTTVSPQWWCDRANTLLFPRPCPKFSVS